MLQRRTLLGAASAAAATLVAPLSAGAATPSRVFDPLPGKWRSFEITTRVDLRDARGQAQAWLPLPSIDNGVWQSSVGDAWSSNGDANVAVDGSWGARMLHVRFASGTQTPFVELKSTVRLQNRAAGAQAAAAPALSDLRFWMQPTALLPTDGLVRKAALAATRGARFDEDRARALYEWIASNCYRDTKVRGCGEGNVVAMLQGDLGGKCADINALFVAMARSVGIAARDVYGLRVAPSGFGYRELGGNSANLSGAQHCRSEVYLQAKGWVAMDPADVTKVMRQESPEWIKSVQHPLVAPVHAALFGRWEGNWVGWNTAHDVVLPGARGPKLPFLMYPVAEDGRGRLDSYAPDAFQYRLSAREITA